VRSKASFVLLLVRVKEVGVARPDARVKAILLPLVVVIVLPPLYAVCKVTELEEHWVTSFDPFRQRGVPAVPGVVKPVKVRKLLPVVLMVTPLEPFGVKVD